MRVGRALTVGLIGLTGGLSVWQANRFFWKRNLIEYRTAVAVSDGTTTPPMQLPADIVKVRLRGLMQNDEFILVGPRPPIETQSGELHGAVYSVFVPFLTQNGEFIWVNRGQVPASEERNVSTLLKQWPDVVDITGMVREVARIGKGKQRVNSDASHTYMKADVDVFWDHYTARNEVADGVKLMPYMVDLVKFPSDGPADAVFPMPRTSEDYLKNQITPFTHLSYCATWTGSFFYGLHYLFTSKSV